MPDLWAMTTTFESVSVGDRLPILVKFESKETIARLNVLAEGVEGERLPYPEEIPDDVALSGAALRGYGYELLEKGFPIRDRNASGSRLELEVSVPVRQGDIISLTGEVTGKREEGGLRLVDCRLAVEDDKGARIGGGEATVSL